MSSVLAQKINEVFCDPAVKDNFSKRSVKNSTL
jgi:hypothetical protein